MGATETKKRIQDAVLDLTMEKGILEINVTELTKRLGMGRSTFYMYYNSVDDVIRDIEDTFFEEFDAFFRTRQVQFDDIYFQHPNPMILDTLRFCRERQKILGALLDEQRGDPSFRFKIKRLIRQTLYEQAVERRYIEEEEPLKREFLIGGHFEMFVYIHQNDLSIDDINAALHVYRTLYGPYRIK